MSPRGDIARILLDLPLRINYKRCGPCSLRSNITKPISMRPLFLFQCVILVCVFSLFLSFGSHVNDCFCFFDALFTSNRHGAIVDFQVRLILTHHVYGLGCYKCYMYHRMKRRVEQDLIVVNFKFHFEKKWTNIIRHHFLTLPL